MFYIYIYVHFAFIGTSLGKIDGIGKQPQPRFKPVLVSICL